MILKEGQIINDGENDLIICAVKEHEKSWYIYTLNEEYDELGFYKVNDLGEEYDFELVEDEKQIQELILVFAKEYAEKNPNVLRELKESNNEE